MRTPQPGPMKRMCAIVLPPVVVTQKRVQGKSTSEKNKFAQKEDGEVLISDITRCWE